MYTCCSCSCSKIETFLLADSSTFLLDSTFSMPFCVNESPIFVDSMSCVVSISDSVVLIESTRNKCKFRFTNHMTRDPRILENSNLWICIISFAIHVYIYICVHVSNNRSTYIELYPFCDLCIYTHKCEHMHVYGWHIYT